MQEITIRVGKGGKINLNVDGVKGGSCKDLTKNLEKAFGNVSDTENTQEYYEQEQSVEGEQSIGGSFGEQSW
jgi:hypothetical protein